MAGRTDDVKYTKDELEGRIHRRMVCRELDSADVLTLPAVRQISTVTPALVDIHLPRSPRPFVCGMMSLMYHHIRYAA